MAEIEDLKHDTVLREEAVAALLAGGNSGVFVDATFGGGGHSRLILETMPSGSRLLAIDCDEFAAARAVAIADGRGGDFEFIRGNYAELPQVLHAHGIDEISGVLFDLGMSSMQLDAAARGFSFRATAPLDMRMDRRSGVTAIQWLRENDEEAVCRVLRQYGEEPEARRVARALVAHRDALETTTVLADIVGKVKRRRTPPGHHPATRVFQALRIAVNDELEKLRQGLDAASRLLRVGGRLVVIAFHSLEDRIVKRFAAADTFPGFGRLHKNGLRPVGKLQRPTADEVRANPRARSARMRVFIKTASVGAV